MLETLEHTSDAIIFIKNKLRNEIFGQCCNLRNDVYFSPTSPKSIKSKNRLVWLVENFGKYFKMDTFIDDYFNEVDTSSHWRSSNKELQDLLNEAISNMRDKKILLNF